MSVVAEEKYVVSVVEHIHVHASGLIVVAADIIVSVGNISEVSVNIFCDFPLDKVSVNLLVLSSQSHSHRSSVMSAVVANVEISLDSVDPISKMCNSQLVKLIE